MRVLAECIITTIFWFNPFYKVANVWWTKAGLTWLPRWNGIITLSESRWTKYNSKWLPPLDEQLVPDLQQGCQQKIICTSFTTMLPAWYYLYQTQNKIFIEASGLLQGCQHEIIYTWFATRLPTWNHLYLICNKVANISAPLIIIINIANCAHHISRLVW